MGLFSAVCSIITLSYIAISPIGVLIGPTIYNAVMMAMAIKIYRTDPFGAKSI